MTREEAKELLPFIIAFSEGKTIQGKELTGKNWKDLNTPNFNGYPDTYRIKPEPQLVPFDCYDWGLFKDKWICFKGSSNTAYKIKSCSDSLVYYGGASYTTYENLLSLYEFQDGSPCGKWIDE